MLRLISFCCKTIPSIYYVYRLNIFVRDSFRGISSGFFKGLIIYGVPSFLILFTLMYFFVLKDSLERQKAKEQNENEERIYTLKIQSIRMFRKYMPLAVFGIICALMFYFYKPNIIALSIKLGVLYSWFLLGETFRIIDIGIKERKRMNKELEG